MNYMRMVSFVEVSLTSCIAEAIYSEREEFFRDNYPRKKVVPSYVLLESVFQTAGRHVREITKGAFAGIIASYSNFNLKRPLLPNENVTFKTTYKSHNDKSCMVNVSIKVDKEEILSEGKLILILEESILSSHLNNRMSSDIENERAYFGETP